MSEPSAGNGGATHAVENGASGSAADEFRPLVHGIGQPSEPASALDRELRAEEPRTPAARPSDSHTRRWRLTLAAVGLASLELIWILLASLRNNELKKLHEHIGAGSFSGAAGAPPLNHIPDNFWPFLGISTGILVIGVLLSAWAHDPIADRWKAAARQRARTEAEYSKLVEERGAKLGRLEKLLADETISPERLALIERISHWHAQSDIAQRAYEEYHLTGYWKGEESARTPRSLSGLTRLRKPLTHGDAPPSKPARDPTA